MRLHGIPSQKPYRDEYGQFTKLVRIHCDSCEMLSICGTPCHETGCPNVGAIYDTREERWIRYRECFYCGCDCEIGTDCKCCEETGWEGEEDE